MIHRVLLVFCSCLLYCNALYADGNNESYIAIIIDDMGYKASDDRRALDLPGQITYAFLPESPHANGMALEANRKGREVMLHLPMQSTQGIYQGPGALTEEMPELEFKLSILRSMASIPFAKGLNNHMGSLLTQNDTAMQWVMEMVAARSFFFIDSRTSANTVAEHIARDNNIPTARRDVFLDHHSDPDLIADEFDKLIKLAQENGSAIAIGHPFPATLTLLENRIPQLAQHNIKLVPVSNVIEFQRLREKQSWQKSLSHSQKGAKNLKQ